MQMRSVYWLSGMVCLGATGGLGGCSIEYASKMTLSEQGLTQQVSVTDTRQPTADQIRAFAQGERRSGTLPQPAQGDPIAMPADLGTEPLLHSISSPLGSAKIVALPRGGATSIMSGLDQVKEITHEVAEAVSTWLDQRFGSTTWGPRAASLVRGRGANDVTDLAAIAWSVTWSFTLFDMQGIMDEAQNAGQNQIAYNVWQRIAQASAALLVEREWISAEAGTMLTGVQAKFVMNDAVGKPQLYALLASLSHHLTQALDLPDTEALNKVMREVSDQWDRDDMNTKLLAIISKRTHDHPHLYALFTPVTDFMTSFKLNASMKVDGLGKPTLTNAEWSKASSTLTWASDRNPWAPGLATPGLYWTAAWITPDDQAQQHAFGDHFRLGDNDLLAFAVAWNAASDAGQQLLQNRIDDGDFMADANGNAPKAGPLESIALNMIDSLGTPGG